MHKRTCHLIVLAFYCLLPASAVAQEVDLALVPWVETARVGDIVEIDVVAIPRPVADAPPPTLFGINLAIMFNPDELMMLESAPLAGIDWVWALDGALDRDCDAQCAWDDGLALFAAYTGQELLPLPAGGYVLFRFYFEVVGESRRSVVAFELDHPDSRWQTKVFSLNTPYFGSEFDATGRLDATSVELLDRCMGDECSGTQAPELSMPRPDGRPAGRE